MSDISRDPAKGTIAVPASSFGGQHSLVHALVLVALVCLAIVSAVLVSLGVPFPLSAVSAFPVVGVLALLSAEATTRFHGATFRRAYLARAVRTMGGALLLLGVVGLIALYLSNTGVGV